MLRYAAVTLLAVAMSAPAVSAPLVTLPAGIPGITAPTPTLPVLGKLPGLSQLPGLGGLPFDLSETGLPPLPELDLSSPGSASIPAPLPSLPTLAPQ